MQLLTGCGSDIALLDNGPLAGQTDSITKALQLVGIKTVKDTLSCMEKGGIVCNTGNLAGFIHGMVLTLSKTFQMVFI
ncbi:MAG: hypothetical protein K1W24_15810 [Lachnospiraceae bacterium]